MNTIFGTGLAVCALGWTLGAAAYAAEASPWAEDNSAAIRLIAGTGQADGGRLRAGLQIKMAPGWHTYWRNPGDAGVPPRFDFSGSSNLASATVLYPAPRLIATEAGNSIGYIDEVVFPLLISPREPGKPVALRVKVDYAACEKLCVPAEGRVALDLTGAASAYDKTLAAAEARVPKPVAADTLELRVKRVNGGPKPLVALDLKAPTNTPVPVYVFVEGPTPEWALPVPEPAQGAPPGRRQFGFELDGLPSGVDPKGRFELTFTVVQGDKAFETKATLE